MSLVEAVLDGIGEGFFAFDREWRFTAYNIAAEAIFRMPRTGVIGRLLWEVSPRIKGTEFDRHYRNVMEYRTREEFESYSVLRPDRYHEVRAFPFGDGVGVAVRDITERQSITLALRERGAELGRVQRIGSVGGLEVDLANGFRSKRSPEYLDLHGLPGSAANETHEQWVGRVHPEDRERVEKHFLATVEGPDKDYKARISHSSAERP